MKLRCPHCEAKLSVPDHMQGRTGRCPQCNGAVPIVAPEPVPAAASVASAPPAAPEAVRPAAPAATFRSNGVDVARVQSGEPAPVIPTGDDDAAYDVVPDEQVGPAPVCPRPIAPVPISGKSRRQKERELEDLRSEGNRYLLTIRLLYLGLGVLMLGFNYYTYTTIEETITEFRSAMTTTPGLKVDPVKVEEIATNLRTALRVECGLYFTLGLIFCGLAVVIHMAPVPTTWAALGTYVGLWVIDILLIEALFGGIAAGQALFSFGTVIKAGIIAGLWYGVQVGQAYDEQVIRPRRALEAEDEEEDGEDDED
jgi:hypothetical protein